MNRGFTLTETIIVVALTTGMMLALVSFYINFNSLYTYQQTVVASANNARSALGAIGDAVLPADHAIVSHSFSGTTRSSGASVLVLELPTVNSSGSIVASAFDYVAFYLSGTDLYRVIDANGSSVRVSGTKKVAALVNALSFTYDNASFPLVTQVSADITAQLNTKKGLVQTHLQQKFYLRNF